MFSKIIYFFKGPFVNADDKGAAALNRLVFIASIVPALYLWWTGKDIQPYHFFWLMINVGYVLSKDRVFSLIDKFLDAFARIRLGKPEGEQDGTN
jgi:hypothetical protein